MYVCQLKYCSPSSWILLIFISCVWSRDDGLSDFEAMLLRKKEEGGRRRKRKDIDIINDNDDIIAQLLSDMRYAAEVGGKSMCQKVNFLLGTD